MFGKKLIALGAGVLLAGSCTGPPRPTVTILVSVDTLRADHLGTYGYDRPTSPTLDAVAQAGVVFEDAMTPSPWTLPAHASMLTGLYPQHHGLKSHERFLPSDVPSIATLLSAAGFETAAVVNSHNLSPRFGLDRGFQKYRYIEERVDRVEPTTALVDQAVAWIDQRSEKPLFVFLHSYDVHSDYRSLPKYEDELVGPYDGAADGTTAQMMAFRSGEAELAKEDAPHLIDRYDAGIRQFDDELARLVRHLKERGIWDDVLLIVTSDHGEEFFEHGGVLHGRTQYQEVARVPLIVKGPGIPAGLRSTRTVSLIDIAPTLAELFGVDVPETDGESFATAWSDAPDTSSRFLFAEADHNNEAHDVTRAVRYEHFKLRFNRSTGEAVLHDLENDPSELDDVSSKFPDAHTALTRELEAFLASPERETPTITLSPEEIERLKSLGYVQD